MNFDWLKHLGRIAPKILQSGELWELVGRQHGVITRRQLIALGVGPDVIKRRMAAGRLHRIHSGVFAVGRPRLSRRGRWMAAVLACGSEAILSHGSAAELWGIRPLTGGVIHVSVPAHVARYPKGLVVHRRAVLTSAEVVRLDHIPLTAPICTLIDIAAQLEREQVEAAINEADKRRLTNPEELRAALDNVVRRPGSAVLRDILDRRIFMLTDSELERRFLRLVRQAGLPPPESGCYVSGFKVDFYWRDLGLVVETDGLTYHRTPAQQARDRVRDQALTASGLTVLRFTHAQVEFEPDYVLAMLAKVAKRLSGAAS